MSRDLILKNDSESLVLKNESNDLVLQDRSEPLELRIKKEFLLVEDDGILQVGPPNDKLLV